MKNHGLKKIILIMTMLVVLATSAVIVATATSDITIGGESVLDSYEFNSKFTAPSRYFVLNGKDYQAKATLTFPSGKKSSFNTLTLDEVGNYTLTYTASVEGVEQTENFIFSVSASPKSMWNSNPLIEATNNAKAPDFNGKSGVLLSAAERSEVKYNAPIYLGDNKVDDDLFTFNIVPQQIGVSDFKTLYLVIEDYEDASNRLYISFTRGYNLLASKKYRTYVQISTDGINYSAEEAYYLNQMGFYGENSKGEPSTPTQVGINIKTGTIKATCGTESILLETFDKALLGEGNEWKGLTSGIANIYVGFMNRLTTAASRAVVYSIDGISMGGNEIVSEKEPEIVIDTSKFESKIYAKKGETHTFLPVSSFDSISGDVTISSIDVYKVLGDVKQRISSSAYGFIPTESGEYYVKYTTDKNAAGISGVNGYYLTVLEEQDCAINFEFGDMEDVVLQGKTITIPEPNLKSGGVGKINLIYTAKIGDKTVEVDGSTLIPEYSGTLELTAHCTDAVQTVTFKKSITIEANTEVFFELGYIPGSAISGDVLNLTHVNAYKYTSKGKENQSVTISFDGKTVSSQKVTIPQTAGIKELKISASGIEKTFDINVIVPSSDENYVSAFFETQNATLESTKSALKMRMESDASIKFRRNILKDVFSVEFSALSDEANFTHVRVNLQDSKNSSNNIVFDVLRGNEASLYSKLLYNGVYYDFYGTFTDPDGTTPFVIAYDSKNNMIVDGEGKGFLLTTSSNGKEFKGFEGDIIYSMQVCGVQGASVLSFNKVGNQNIKSNVKTTTNNQGPIIAFYEEFEPTKIGEEYVVPTAYVWDALNNFKSLTLTVKFNDETIYEDTDADEYKFTPTELGTYTLTFVALDEGNKKTTVTKELKVTSGQYVTIGGVQIPTDSMIAPTVEIDKNYKSSVNVGEEFNIAKITVSDDNTQATELSIYAYVITPSGRRTILLCTPTMSNSQDSYTAETKYKMLTDTNYKYVTYTADKEGKYQIYYVVKDAEELTTIVHYTVEVNKVN